MSVDIQDIAGIGGIGAGAGFALRWLFTRQVETHDAERAEIRASVKEILARLQSMGDEQIRQRGDISGLVKDIAQAQTASRAAHDRIDALVATPPRQRAKR